MRMKNIPFRQLISYASLALALFWFSACSEPITNRNSSGETIICFGDSLTAGQGTTKEKSYPAVLSAMLNQDVINAGITGETSQDGLKRLEKAVLRHNPRLVIVEFGANDFFKRVSQEETFGNVDEIVRRIQEQGAMVVIAEVRMGLIHDYYYKGFEEIAQNRGALLITNIMQGITLNPELKSDGIHPNAAGYKKMAKKIFTAVAPLLNND